jgi:hypothetical protein
LAVVTFPFILLSILGGLYAGIIVMSVSSIGPFAPNTVMLRGEVQAMCSAVLKYADDHRGRGPDHAVLLLPGGYLMSGSFVSIESETYEIEVPVANTTLDQFASLSSGGQEVVARRAVNAMPRGTIAHRFGDFVFTYHGLDLRDTDPGVWVVVMTADPDSNSSPWFGREIWAGRADGTVSAIHCDDLPQALEQQNRLRKRLGLPPLPDPTTITHTKPAVRD